MDLFTPSLARRCSTQIAVLYAPDRLERACAQRNGYNWDVLNDWARGFKDRDGKFVFEVSEDVRYVLLGAVRFRGSQTVRAHCRFQLSRAGSGGDVIVRRNPRETQSIRSQYCTTCPSNVP
jgi:hypothetical protein